MQHALSTTCWLVILISAIPVQAQTNSGNFKDGMDAASAFCNAVDGVAWSYVGGLSNATRDPVQGDFDRAAYAVGAQLEAIYSAHAPADHRRVFRAGWERGMKNCAKEVVGLETYSK